MRHDALNFKDVICGVVLIRAEKNFFECGVNCYIIILTSMYSNFIWRILLPVFVRKEGASSMLG